MNLPRHPGHDDDQPARTSTSRGTQAVIAIIVAVVVLVVVLHLTGVIGGGAH